MVCRMVWYGAPPTPWTAIVATKWWQLDRTQSEHAQPAPDPWGDGSESQYVAHFGPLEAEKRRFYRDLINFKKIQCPWRGHWHYGH
jgi:hypothetical protein